MSESIQPTSSAVADALGKALAVTLDTPSADFEALAETTSNVCSSDFADAVPMAIANKLAKATSADGTLNNQKLAQPCNPSTLIDVPKMARATENIRASAISDMPSKEKAASDTTPSTVRQSAGISTAAKRPNPPAAVNLASGEKLAKSVSPSVTGDNSGKGSASTEAEILACPDSGLPNWNIPEIIAALLETDSERERRLVECIVQYQWAMYGHLDGALEAERAVGAAREFAVARDLSRIVLETIENLVRHRKGGVQKVMTLHPSGPRIGLAAKVEQLRRPKTGSPEARLVERVEHMEAAFYEVANRFHQNARGLRDTIRQVEPVGVPAHWAKDLERWEELRLKALHIMTAVSDLVNRLERGGRQIVVTQHELFHAEHKSDDAADRTSDVEQRTKSAKTAPHTC